MRSLTKIFDAYPTIFFIICVSTLTTIYFGFSEISLVGLEATDLGTKFLSLIFIALVIERAVEIYIKNRYSKREADEKEASRIAATCLRTYKDALEDLEGTIVPDIGSASAIKAAVEAKREKVKFLSEKVEQAREALLVAKTEAEPGLQALSEEKKRAATIAALALSLGIAVVGIRILTQFLPEGALPLVDTVKGNYQVQAFYAIDIILTSLLLSGGADGMHQLVKDFLSDRDELLAAS